jgi:hypothetical protein
MRKVVLDTLAANPRATADVAIGAWIHAHQGNVLPDEVARLGQMFIEERDRLNTEAVQARRRWWRRW